MGRPGRRQLDVLDVTREATARLHDLACARGDAMYPDPLTGLWVMTRVGLLARGACCGQGCRHCPYAGTAHEHRDREATLRNRDKNG